ncbi:pyruvate, phosphate dikinase [bacterium]|jgi:pyruvate, orthophosphate dikinase|nr:pyruvate, phosphate dikinase [bacterium]MBT3795406.1 pyruvate, phosphate dikinase [bacterium]MBT4633876.1 pyruvate, phosphate dikinase [bacterium]
MKNKKNVFYFGNKKADGNGKMKEVLGGKGAGLAEMTEIGINVPPGFTISTNVCAMFYQNKKQTPAKITKEIRTNLVNLEKMTKKGFGNVRNPLLVSVRSGAMFSMPGMMDTILNLGLNDKTVVGLAKKTKNPRFAWDAYRRFIQMFSDVVLNVSKDLFEEKLEELKRKKKVKHDIELNEVALKSLVQDYKKLVKSKTKKSFPQDPIDQLVKAIDAVFLSWNNQRAIFYRKKYGIPSDIGTGVTVQSMVFGNMGKDCGTGVGFTRDPLSGEKELFAEYLLNAQGEDVVAGIRTPKLIKAMQREMGKVHHQIVNTAKILERHFKDMQDFEFTIENEVLYLLQTRSGKRSGIAAAKIACDMVKESLITKKDAISRVEPEHLEQFLFPIFDPDDKKKFNVLTKGLAASPGAASGQVALDAQTAVELSKQGKRVVLVTKETSPDDIHGMSAASGLLTARGGRTSHAAVVGRQMGKVCVVGAEEVRVDLASRTFSVADEVIHEGDFISIDGFEGKVYKGDIPVVASEVIQVMQGNMKEVSSERYLIFSTILKWADTFRRLKIRTNADVPSDAKVAMKFGAEGIGLCRTEHMFFAEDRIKIMQEMILSTNLKDRVKNLNKLQKMQKEDFVSLFTTMKGFPCTIRLLDPPLHEFLPKREDLMLEVKELELLGTDKKKLEETRSILERVEELHEFNPMLGLRGCRLGNTMPEITSMQARAIFEAAIEVSKKKIKVVPEIMIPLVGMVTEFKMQKDIINQVAKEVLGKKKIAYTVGTMIEVPRATTVADQIAKEAEFFSFGTNDLTQTVFAYSRDDAGKFINHYLETKVELDGKNVEILSKDPFTSIDIEGVGELMKLGLNKGKSARKNLKVGICGEHGGDPSSIDFCHEIGLDYVSCSPFRVPIARLAAARIAIKEAN